MKLILIALLCLVIVISGCATLKTEKINTTASPEKLPLQEGSPSSILKSPENKGASTGKSEPNPYAAQEPSAEEYNNPPLISSTSLNPSNPSLGDAFELKITAEDDKGVKQLSWTSSKPLSGSSSGTFECGLQKTCSNAWQFTSEQEGVQQINVVATDSSGKEASKIFDLNVGPARPKKSPSPTPSPSTVQASPTTQSISGCSSNSDCGYKKICTAKKCVDVQCTTDSQCTGCKRCSSNNCVSCGSGPYGCYC